MKNAAFRLLAYATIALLAYVALQMDPPASRSPANPFSGTQEAEPEWREARDTLRSGETLSELFGRMGLDVSSTDEAIRASSLDARRVPANLPATSRSLATDSIPSEIVLRLSVDRLIRLRRTESGWVGEEELLPWTTDTVVVMGVVESNLYDAMDNGASLILSRSARFNLTNSLAALYDYRVDMSRDLQVGDNFRVLFERLTGPEGVEKIGRILAASMMLSSRETQAVRFEFEGAEGSYFDQNGRPMKSGFLRNPLEFRRISSTFGARRHPILGTMKNHTGTDYAADAGTPVRAIGDGSVIFAGWRNGYGNVIDIRHRNGFVSRYAHLQGFARGLRSGMPVEREAIIGRVGMTGLATGPHLHFEILVNGVQRNPGPILATVQPEEPLPESEIGRFTAVRTLLVASLFSGSGTVKIANNF